MSTLEVSTVEDQSQLVLYPGSGTPEVQDKLKEPMLGPGESTTMFRPMSVDSPEIEQIRFSFVDVQGGRWERMGTDPPGSR